MSKRITSSHQEISPLNMSKSKKEEEKEREEERRPTSSFYTLIPLSKCQRSLHGEFLTHPVETACSRMFLRT
jgi:hypothetical protein